MLPVKFLAMFSGGMTREDAQPGDIAGRFSIDDPDNGQLHRYMLEPEGVFLVQGDTLVVSGDLNYEMEREMFFNVTVVDDGLPPLNVSDVYMYWVDQFLRSNTSDKV